ncbi:MAG TPA: VCBS repeat-containing protein, partial [Thermoanaerobaculia bacterium]
MPRDLTVVLALLAALAAAPMDAQCTGCGGASFGPGARAFPSSVFYGLTVSADFNRDGIPDVAILSLGDNSGHVSILLGDGSGGFSPAVDYSTLPAISPQSIAIGDFDSDGKLDLIVAGYPYPIPPSYPAAILRGVGDGTFLPGEPLSFPLSLGYVSAGDFNGDGKLDLVAVNGGFATILFGDGNGGFPSSILLPSGGFGGPAVVGDVNGDGISDFVIPNSAGTVAVGLGTKTGPFAPPRLFPAGDDPQRLALVQLTSLPRLDIVVRSRDGLEVLLGTGTGTFASPVHYAVPGDNIYQAPLLIGDFDGDGKADVLTTSGIPYTHYFFRGNGAGALLGPTSVESTAFPSIVKDFDGDGLSDIGYSIGGFLVRKNRGGPLSMFPTTLRTPGTSTILVGDFNEDGREDIVTAGGDVLYFAATPTGFAAPVSLRECCGPLAAVADFNGDGHLDIVTVKYFETLIYQGDGQGGFSIVNFNLPTIPVPVGIAVGDFNGDKIPDLVVLNADGSLYVLLGVGDGTFSAPVITPGIPNSIAIAIADFNKDGKLDAAVLTLSSVATFLGDGKGGFGSSQMVAALQNPGSITAGDFDNDGNPDIAITAFAGFNNGYAQVFWGDGKGNFSAGSAFSVGSQPGGIASADFNQDGLPDLVIVGGSPSPGTDGSTGFWMNDGQRGFAPSSSFEVSDHPVAIADLNADGLPDVVVAFQNFVTILYNTNCKARNLVELQEPGACSVAGAPFVPQPQLGVFDDGGNRVECDSGVVTASLAAGPSGATLGGTKTATAVSGLATFTNLSVSKAGTGYQIDFTHPVAGKSRSLKFTAGLAVSISGPSQSCQGAPAVFSAGAVYDSYTWQVDGVTQLSFGKTLTLTGLSAGPHTIALTVTKDRCSVSNS